MLDNVRFVSSDLRYSTPILRPKSKFPESLSHELNNVLFYLLFYRRTNVNPQQKKTLLVGGWVGGMAILCPLAFAAPHLKIGHLSGPGSLSDNAVEFSHLITLRLTIKQSSID